MKILSKILFLLFLASALSAAESSVNIALGLDSSANSYEIGFCNGEDTVITTTGLQLTETGFGTDDGNTYVYWKIRSATPFKVALDFSSTGNLSELGTSVSWQGKTDDSDVVVSHTDPNVLFVENGKLQLDITTAVSSDQVAIGSYVGTLVLTISQE